MTPGGWVRALLLVLLNALCAVGPLAAGGHVAPDARPPRPVADAPRYDQVQQKSVHNAYARRESLGDQLAWHNVRSLELDLHVEKAGRRPVAGDWFVYHFDGPFGRATSCARLSGCLARLRAFHEAAPGHAPVTVWLDLKQDFDLADPAHGPEALDAAIGAWFPREAVLTPADLAATCPGAHGPQEAVRRGDCGWPTLPELRGRFLFVLTRGGRGDTLDAYYGGSGHPDLGHRLAFIAPELPQNPFHARGAVFYNLPAHRRQEAAILAAQGYVSRVWGLEDQRSFREALAYGAHHLANDRTSAEADPWSRTHGEHGWPFTCVPGYDGPGCDGAAGDAGLLNVEVSGPPTGLTFRYEPMPVGDGMTAEWRTEVAVAGSHAPAGGNACLMARGDPADPAAAFVALCRSARGELRAFARARPGAPVRLLEARDEAWPGLRLAVTPAEGGARVTLWAASGGTRPGRPRRWSLVTRTLVPSPLPFQGLAANGDGGRPLRFVFGGVQRFGPLDGWRSLGRAPEGEAGIGTLGLASWSPAPRPEGLALGRTPPP